MDAKLKKRLLIAIAIVALVVIFVPMFFSHTAVDDGQDEMTIPRQPDQTAQPLSMTDQTASTNTVSQSNNATTVPTNTTAPAQQSMQSQSAQTNPSLPVQSNPQASTPTQSVNNMHGFDQSQTVQSDAADVAQKQPTSFAQPVDSAQSSQASLKQQPVPNADMKPLKASVKKPLTSSKPVLSHAHVASHHAAKPKKVVIHRDDLTVQHPHPHIRSVNANSEPNDEYSTPKINSGWVVQLGSFADKSKTETVVARIKKAGHKAFAYKADVHGQTMYRVYAGPFDTSEKAKKALSHLHQQLHLSGYVHSFG